MKKRQIQRFSTIVAIVIMISLMLTGSPMYAATDTSAEDTASETQTYSESEASAADTASEEDSSSVSSTSEENGEATASGVEATLAANDTETVNATADVSTEIYLNGSSGNDSNDGLTYDTAVKTFARAKELAAELASQTDETITIYITGTVSISGDISLAGVNAIVKRYSGYSDFLMNVTSNATATLSSITIDGNSEEATSVSAGLISSYGTLNIQDGTVLQNNVITSTAYFKALGGAIRVYGGTLNMTGGTITGNSANFGGGVFVGAGKMNMSGGVISNNKAVDMYNTRYSMRFPASGGGICVYDNHAVLNVSDSAQIINNSSEDMGGGISVGIFLPSNYEETLNMTGGTISGNTAGSAGGGIFVQGGRYETAIGTANISGGTISNNSMTGEGEGNDSFGGGGIYVNGSSTYYNGVVNLTNVLITDNEATLQGGGYAACPISVTHIYVNDGAAIYANSASSADEIYILASNDYGTHSGDPTYNISSTMLGGTPYIWKYSSDSTEVPYNDLAGTLDADNNEELSLYTDVTSDTAAESLATVTITGNTSATRGGGIGSNGTVNIGTATDTIDITVNKVWENDSSSDRPDSIRVNIYRTIEGSDENPEYVGYETMSPDSSGDWPSVTISNLPATDSEGNTYTYTVEEASVDGYSSKVSGNQDDGFTITNTKTISVTKVWNDGNDQDGLRPDSVTVQLYADGVASGDAVVLSEDNSWTYTWTDLDVNANGTAISYTVEETSVPDGYTSDVTGDAASGFTITNTHEPETTSVSVSKVWDDAGNQDGLRPDSVTVQLYADGVASGDAVVLSEDNAWTYTWTDLDAYANGTAISYTVEETSVPDGYTSDVTGDAASGFTITNTHEPETISIPVTKVWVGDAGEKAVIHLYADGEEIDSCELNEENDWQYTFTDLAAMENGNIIRYTISEDAVDGYTSSITGDQEEGYTVTNAQIDTTENSNKTTASTSTSQQNNSTPSTGDSSSAGLYLLLLLASAAGVICLVHHRRKGI